MLLTRLKYGFSIKTLQNGSFLSNFFDSFSSQKLIFILLIFHFYNVQKMPKFDEITNENNEDHNKKWPYILDHPCRIMITGGYGLGKTNGLLNLIKEQDSDLFTAIEKIYLYAKDLTEPKHQLLIKKRENA